MDRMRTGTANRYCEHYDQLLQQATQEHLQGNGPVGIHLSGGLDSSLLTAMVGKQEHDALCFTIVERTSYLAGDVKAACDMARRFGLPWHPVLFNYQTLLDDIDFGLESLEQSVWMMDSPLFDIEWIFKAELNRKIRTQRPDLKILLMGQGADEFAGGYSKRAHRTFNSWDQYLLHEVKPGIQAHFSHSNIYSQSAYTPLRQSSLSDGSESCVGTPSPYHQWMLLMVRQLQHHNLWHEDRTSSMYSMEARVPFLDHRLVELLASIPSHLHPALFWNKHIVRTCMQKHVPDYDNTRQKVAFCWTDDSRTLEIIIHSMASRISPAFQQKYVDSPGFPFDRDETMGMIRRVLARERGFFNESLQLLSRMTSCIFHSMHMIPRGFEYPAGTAYTPSSLQVVRESRWASLHAHLESEPTMPFTWRYDHHIRLMAGASIARESGGHSEIVCSLIADGEVAAEVRYPAALTWINSLFDHLEFEDACTHSILQLSQELHVGLPQLADLLNTLLQCGFITTPTIEAASDVYSTPSGL